MVCAERKINKVFKLKHGVELKLLKKPKKPIIIEGFPGFGLVGNISTEFLIEHLNAKLIGYIKLEELPPVTAVHEGKIIQPISIFYDELNNIIIFHVLTPAHGIEWKLVECMLKIAAELEAKEIISIEGVLGGAEETEPRAFYYTNRSENKPRFEKAGVDELREGIVVGVTGALLLEREPSISCIFIETKTGVPDAKAAAKAIQILDIYLGLKVDYRPLLKRAEKFEAKIKRLLQQAKAMEVEREKKKLSYIV